MFLGVCLVGDIIFVGENLVAFTLIPWGIMFIGHIIGSINSADFKGFNNLLYP